MGESEKNKPTTPGERNKPPLPGRRERFNEQIHERIEKKAPVIRDTLKPPPDPKKSA
jgi:hypothetical protein